MLVQLKSNGSKHTITAETWALMSRDKKRDYRVVNSTEEQVAKNSVSNDGKSQPDTGDKKVNKLEPIEPVEEVKKDKK